jgi:hypothetical protein
MKMCLAPCYKGCSDERYTEESTAVERFLATRGESRLVTIRAERDAASANLEFESAAAHHAQVQKVEAVRALAPELVRPLSQLRAVILQPPAVGPTAPAAQVDEVLVFLFEGGRFRGPAAFSTVGMRIQNEQSGSSSLFAQPIGVEAIPEETGNGEQGLGNSEQGLGNSEQGLGNREQGTGNRESRGGETAAPRKAARGMLEARMEDALASLAAPTGSPSSTIRQGHLALLKRWYYRPEAKRSGEIFFPDSEGMWPVKAVLRGVGRVAARLLTTSSAS